MSEIMFSSDSKSKKEFQQLKIHELSTFVYNIIVLELMGNNGSKMQE